MGAKKIKEKPDVQNAIESIKKSTDTNQALFTLAKVRELPDEACFVVADLLDNPNEEIRIKAMYTLMNKHNLPAAIQTQICHMIEESDPDAQLNVAQYMAEIEVNCPEIQELVCRAIENSPDSLFRLQAASTVMTWRPVTDAVKKMFLHLIDSPSVDERRMGSIAFSYLPEIADAEVIEKLYEIFQKEEIENIRLNAALALDAIQPTSSDLMQKVQEFINNYDFD